MTTAKNDQTVNLYQQIQSHNTATPPLVLNVLVKARRDMYEGGSPTNRDKNEQYIMLSALPDELRQRVILAIQALSTGH